MRKCPHSIIRKETNPYSEAALIPRDFVDRFARFWRQRRVQGRSSSVGLSKFFLRRLGLPVAPKPSNSKWAAPAPYLDE